jgi:hypothetical protein
MNSQNEKSQPTVSPPETIALPQADPETTQLTAADYVYRIAAVTAGIILLATVV